MPTEVKNLKIDTASSGDTPILAAQGVGVAIRLLAYHIVAAGAVVVKWRSGTTDLTGGMTMATGVPFSMQAAPAKGGDDRCLLETAKNEALVLNLGGAVQVSGHCTVEVSG